MISCWPVCSTVLPRSSRTHAGRWYKQLNFHKRWNPVSVGGRGWALGRRYQVAFRKHFSLPPLTIVTGVHRDFHCASFFFSRYGATSLCRRRLCTEVTSIWLSQKMALWIWDSIVWWDTAQLQRLAEYLQAFQSWRTKGLGAFGQGGNLYK